MNNFDALRILAALAVLLSHTVTLTRGTNAAEPFIRLSHGQTTGGSIAVTVFFVMSGALVTSSFLRAPLASVFVAFRALRILPALWVIVPILAFVVGPLVSTLPFGQYMASPQLYIFVLRNMALLHTENLPGVFAGNPLPAVMDGSLWTLRYEVACYGVVLLLGAFKILRFGPVLSLYILALAVCMLRPADVRPPLVCAFLAGASIQLAAGEPRPWFAALCGLGWFLSFWTSHYVVLAGVLGPYPIMALARSKRIRLPPFAYFGDFSYGLYIYAFPIQQVVVCLFGPAAGWGLTVALAAPAAILCGLASWHWIERPALRLKARHSSHRAGCTD